MEIWRVFVIEFEHLNLIVNYFRDLGDFVTEFAEVMLTVNEF